MFPPRRPAGWRPFAEHPVTVIQSSRRVEPEATPKESEIGHARRSGGIQKKLADAVAEEAAKYPGKPVEVFATDEHRIGLKPVTRRVWAPIGERPIAHGHHRFDWLYVTAFASPATGETFWYVSNGVSKDFFEALLETFAREAEAGLARIIACTCYHPLFVFNQFGDLERCSLRPGNVHSADGWDGVLKPVVERYQGKVSRIYFRADAGFANPDVYEFLEAERIKYAIRLPANRILQERIGHLLTRPIGRPPNEVRRSYANFTYQAGSWTKSRRVVAKVEWHPGELYPRVGFIVTNMSRPAENVVAFYNKRGTCEQWIKEGKGAIKWTRLSCRTFAANAVRLQLHALAYNLGNFLRTLATPEPIKDWSLTSLKEKLIKIGAKVVSHGRYVAFQMAEVAIPKNLFADILRLIAELRPPPATSTA